jgi:Ca2+-binding EF-hand superfamily protein
MKTNTLIIVATVIGLAGVANAEEGKRPMRPDNRVDNPEAREMLKKFDKDGDGKLNEEERMAAKEVYKAREEAFKKEMLEKFDKDGNGELSEEEREAAKKERMSKHEEHKKEMFKKFIICYFNKGYFIILGDYFQKFKHWQLQTKKLLQYLLDYLQQKK